MVKWLMTGLLSQLKQKSSGYWRRMGRKTYSETKGALNNSQKINWN